MMPKSSIRLEPLVELRIAQRIGQCRAVPVSLGPERAILAIHAPDFDVDPSPEMFFLPSGQLSMTLFTTDGKVLWERPLGRGVIPGVWFCPVFAFDLDGDGVDEVWWIGNRDEQHPLGHARRRLVRLDPRSGEESGDWPWPYARDGGEALYMTYRDFILGGHVRGQPVLVTAQGTYRHMDLQAWSPDMSFRWQLAIPREPGDPRRGAAGSHMCPVADLNGDGVDELMWGERCIELDRGRELFCADRERYQGHSDVVQPVWDRAAGRWMIFTCRESDPKATPRVVMFDSAGQRLWGAVEAGHMDMGWVARLGDGGRHIAAAIRVGAKSCGPDGRFHQQIDEFAFDAASGRAVTLPFSHYRTVPIDLDGDGLHELVRGQPSGDGEVLDRHGAVIGSVGGPVAMASKFTPLPGEQLLSYSPDGWVRIWADRAARDTPEALARYAHPFYAANQRLTGTGYNMVNLGGI